MSVPVNLTLAPGSLVNLEGQDVTVACTSEFTDSLETILSAQIVISKAMLSISCEQLSGPSLGSNTRALRQVRTMPALCVSHHVLIAVYSLTNCQPAISLPTTPAGTNKQMQLRRPCKRALPLPMH